ncbi:MAG: radical SAM protein [Candidatus Aminicenantes bacterium]|nr:radical SAM protein [Candidatus Aminicenantes bacterium]
MTALSSTDIGRKIRKIETALERLSPHERHCRLCPRECGIDRLSGEIGRCGTGAKAVLGGGLLHFGEEPPLSGVSDVRREGTSLPSLRRGSGTVFFSGCSLQCLFCQNHQLSWGREGRAVTDEELAEVMLDLQRQGALNINLVTPGHVLLPILRALKRAYGKGLALPLVYNTGGYEKASVLGELDGVVDIYLPDLKYRSPQVSGAFSSAPDYFDHASRAVEEMRRQRPRLILGDDGIALEGLIIRHLVLPGCVSDSLAVLEWIAERLTPSVCLSLLGQYQPVFRAPDGVRRGLTAEEYERVLEKAEALGFEEVFIQSGNFRDEDHFLPDFNRENPFSWDGGFPKP